MAGALLEPVQALKTSGARGVALFSLGGVLHLAVPQLAEDVPGQQAGVEAGNSDLPALIYRWSADRFEGRFRLPASGAEDVEPFRIGGELFLAIANLRTGQGPYDLNVDSVLYRWSGSSFVVHQRFPTFAAKQWHYFTVGGRHFLALAQGVDAASAEPRNSSRSAIFEWDGQQFRSFQEIDSIWGYNWLYFQAAGEHLLGYADHKAPSRILRWTGTTFETAQTLPGDGGRAFCAFRADGDDYLAFARLPEDTVLLRRKKGSYAEYQQLSGPGGREFAWIDRADGRFLVQVDFLTGSREQPRTDLHGHIYRWSGHGLQETATFPTSGATGVTAVPVAGGTLVAVSESLSPEIRFRTDTHVYRMPEPDGDHG